MSTLLRLATPNVPVMFVQASVGLDALAGIALVFPVLMLMQMMSAGAMGVPLFTAGRIKNTVKASEARQQQLATQYLQAIQHAFREVEDARVFHRKVREIRTERERRVVATRRALALATLRYDRGLATQLDVLDAERQLFSAELDLTATARDQLTAVVQVYKALGGGWQSHPK